MSNISAGSVDCYWMKQTKKWKRRRSEGIDRNHCGQCFSFFVKTKEANYRGGGAPPSSKHFIIYVWFPCAEWWGHRNRVQHVRFTVVWNELKISSVGPQSRFVATFLLNNRSLRMMLFGGRGRPAGHEPSAAFQSDKKVCCCFTWFSRWADPITWSI